MNAEELLNYLLHLKENDTILKNCDIVVQYDDFHMGIIGESIDYTTEEEIYPTKMLIENNNLVLK